MFMPCSVPELERVSLSFCLPGLPAAVCVCVCSCVLGQVLHSEPRYTQDNKCEHKCVCVCIPTSWQNLSTVLQGEGHQAVCVCVCVPTSWQNLPTVLQVRDVRLCVCVCVYPPPWRTYPQSCRRGTSGCVCVCTHLLAEPAHSPAG